MSTAYQGQRAAKIYPQAARGKSSQRGQPNAARVPHLVNIAQIDRIYVDVLGIELHTHTHTHTMQP